VTLCPIAIVLGCKKCPAFKVCPLKGVIGDQAKPADQETRIETSTKTCAAGPKSRIQ